MLRDEIDSLNKVLRTESVRAKCPLPPVPNSPDEAEKRVLICSVKENHQGGVGVEAGVSGIGRRRKVHSCASSRVSDLTRSPLQDIGNSSRQNAKSIIHPSSYSTCSTN